MPAGSELRHDPLSGRLTIVAAGRAARPHTVAREAAEVDAGPEHCPFCPGHETMTPPEVMRTGDGEPGTDGWRTRVVPNLYPIVGGEGTHEGATGAHEVVVLSPDHFASFGELGDDQAVEVFAVLVRRVAAHLADGHAYATTLINHRRAAGASIAHPHAQVVALDFVPPEVQAAQGRAVDAGDDDLLALDLTSARAHDTILLDRDVIAWLPHSGSSPFLARVGDPLAPARFDLASSDQLAAHALTVRDTLTLLAGPLGDPPYNVTVHTAAADGTGPRHWYTEIKPRLTVIAGFEMASGVLVNSTPPESAAALIRAHHR